MWMSALVIILLAVPHVALAGETQRVLVTFDKGSRAAVVNLSASLRPLGISVLKASERHGVAVLDGPPESLKLVAKNLPGGISTEVPVSRRLQACDNQCLVTDTVSSVSSNETVPWGVKMVQASSTEAGPESLFNSTVWICVIDTGLDKSHRDLKANNIHGCDGSNCLGPFYKDAISHGTHVTGTIAASEGNNLDVVGVIPKGANLFAYNMFPNGEATTVDSVMAMLTCEDWLDRKKKEDPTARMVINMSYGDPGVSSVERNVAKKMNERGDILMVASSGNNQLDYPFKLFYPASYDDVVSVGAIDCTGNIAPFSIQNDQVELVAPGSTVISNIVPVVEDITTLHVRASKSSTPIKMETSPVAGSDLGRISAPMVDCGIGKTTCPNGKGKICLVARSVWPDYSCKMANVMRSGCVAMIITNEWDPKCAPLEGRIITGKCEREDQEYLPVVTTSKFNGDRLRAWARIGTAIAELEIIPGKYKTYTRQLAGTSMAAPHVTAVAARIWADFARCNSTDVRLALQQGAKPMGAPGRNPAYGFGLLQAVSSRNILAARDCAMPSS